MLAGLSARVARRAATSNREAKVDGGGKHHSRAFMCLASATAPGGLAVIPPKRAHRMKALVLSGGGARGAYEAGAALALARIQPYDLVCGTSIGAINAAFIAAGRTEQLESFWCEILPERAPVLFPHIPRMRHMLADFGKLGRGSRWRDAFAVLHAISDTRSLKLFDERRGSAVAAPSAPLARELDELVGLSAIGCQLVVAATNVTAGKPAAFHARCSPSSFACPSHRAERLASIEWRALDPDRFSMGILASAALPGLLAPVELTFEQNASYYADGGLVHNSPIGLAIDAGATDITVVFVDPVVSMTRVCPERTVGRMACALFVLWQQRALDYELRLVEATNALVRAGALPDRREIRVQYVQPERPLDIDILAFDDAAAIAQAFQQGVHDAELGPRSM